MHGIDGDHGAGQAKGAEQGLHSRDLIGIVVAIEMRQHQGCVGGEGAQHVGGAAVVEIVEAVSLGVRTSQTRSSARRLWGRAAWVHKAAAWLRNAVSTEVASSCRKMPRMVV